MTDTQSTQKKWQEHLLAFVIYCFVMMLHVTYRYRFHRLEVWEQTKRSHPHNSAILALWHEQLLSAILAHKGQKLAPLASLSKDGDFVTYTLERLGYHTIRGSSSKGGPEARKNLVEHCSQGYCPAITVDGPRGPRRLVKSGVIDIARRSSTFIVPMIVSAKRSWTLKKSWDQFNIPKPFTTVHIVYTEAVEVPPDTSGQQFGVIKNTIKASMDHYEDWISKYITQ